MTAEETKYQNKIKTLNVDLVSPSLHFFIIFIYMEHITVKLDIELLKIIITFGSLVGLLKKLKLLIIF